MIFIFGSARSGSTWLGKIFDSHPEVFYLHEPDISDRGDDLLPHWFQGTPSEVQIDKARQYLKRLRNARNLRTIGNQPFFGKSYRGTASEVTRRALIYSAKIFERAGAGALDIPDLVPAKSAVRPVIKSVSALGRAEALLTADSTIAPILLIRHPCGFVESMLRGAKQGVMTSPNHFGKLAETRSAVRLGLNGALSHADDAVGFLAWTWLISNAEANSAVKRANGIVLNYDALASDPFGPIRALFERLRLGWPVQTESFLRRSQESNGDYYSVYRNSGELSQGWKRALAPAATAKIREIVSRDPLGAQFFSTGS